MKEAIKKKGKRYRFIRPAEEAWNYRKNKMSEKKDQHTGDTVGINQAKK